MRRFRIAFSFAGKKRDFVGQVAAILAKQFGEPTILYDKFHEAEFARRDLGVYLPELYHQHTDLVVVVACPDYEENEWCGLEWAAIHDLLKQRRDEEVMLCHFDRAGIKGLYGTAGWIELNNKTPEQTATLILERLALNERNSKDFYTKPASAGSKAPSTSTPNNLPRLQPFFGREAELATIREALDPDSRTWGALIDGPGGMGKTSLAVRAAYDCPPGLFQRIVFVSVKDREMDDHGVRPLGNLLVPGFLEMLNELARELGLPDMAKSPENHRIRLLLDALRPVQALLILDNLESLSETERGQIITFVKRLPQGCKAILTSRPRIGSGSEELILEKLDQKAALATLADLARRNPLLARTGEAERIALYVQTAGKPLLLRWVAGQLGRGSCTTFAHALDFLSTCPPDDDPLEFIFGDLAKEFSADEEKVLCALTYFSLSAKVEHIAEMAGIMEHEADTGLRTLTNRSLVVPDQEGKNYALVPMVADFLRRHRRVMVTEIGGRLENRAAALIEENGEQQHHRFPQLEAAWPTVAPALPLFLAGESSRLHLVCTRLHRFLNFEGRWDEWLLLSQQAEVKALKVGDYQNAGWRAYDAGYVHYLRGQSKEVLAWAHRADEHWKTAHAGAREQGSALRLLGLGHRLNRDYVQAIAAFDKALSLWRSLRAESQDVAVALNARAEAERLSGKFSEANEDYVEALRIARAEGYHEGEATYTGNRAALALDEKNWAAAEALAREALPLSVTVGRREMIAGNCHRLAQALARQGKATDALPFARDAVDILIQLRSPDLEAARATQMECESQTNLTSNGLNPN